MNELLNLGTPVLLGVAISLIIVPFKAWPRYPNWMLPHLAILLGAVLYPWAEGLTGRNVILGIVIGGSAVGAHQLLKQTSQGLKDVGAGLGLLVAALALGLGVGCATLGPGQQPNPQQLQQIKTTAAIVQTSAQIGVFFVVREEPKTRAYFEAAVVVLDLLAAEQRYDPDQLKRALAGIEVNELQTAEAQMAISAAINLYQMHFGQWVAGKMDANIYLRPVLIGLRTGIVLGLGEQNGLMGSAEMKSPRITRITRKWERPDFRRDAGSTFTEPRHFRRDAGSTLC